MTDKGAINSIMLDFPESIQTERLTIRAPRWGDGKEMNEAIRESAEQLRPWMPFAESIPSIEESEIVVRKARLKFMDRSAKVAERAGYTLEGILRKINQDRTGEWVDMMVFAKVRGSEFE
ncbi:GNAT family N-acetyltransferase [Paenibacillus silvae]|uniref:GNAT family N-acetyltransferase n=1 Tax=Paenibacillus silvae TaxID=1325358 RepID=UPI002002B4B9|nr:hypothetical protein [Paenibacillus silvae]MCK6073788.1 hypothetical protein [Paenibacillus silvae]MCK6148736.1 hypothetical protein [Paenibacillus silvae]MCK6267036.1 hypothetical protein [Paenibacillus silvae]